MYYQGCYHTSMVLVTACVINAALLPSSGCRLPLVVMWFIHKMNSRWKGLAGNPSDDTGGRRSLRFGAQSTAWRQQLQQTQSGDSLRFKPGKIDCLNRVNLDLNKCATALKDLRMFEYLHRYLSHESWWTCCTAGPHVCNDNVQQYIYQNLKQLQISPVL